MVNLISFELWNDFSKRDSNYRESTAQNIFMISSPFLLVVIYLYAKSLMQLESETTESLMIHNNSMI